MEENYIAFQTTLANTLEWAKTQSDLNLRELVEKSFAEFLSVTEHITDLQEALMLFRETEHLFSASASASLPFYQKHCVDENNNANCEKLLNAKNMIFCQKCAQFDKNSPMVGHLCLPFLKNSDVKAAFIMPLRHELKPWENSFINVFKALIESLIQNRMKEIELQKRAHEQALFAQKLFAQSLEIEEKNLEIQRKSKEQDLLNQKLFAQNIEIEHKNFEIQESKKKITEQFNELQANEEELLQFNEELVTLIESLEVQKMLVEEKEKRLKTILESQTGGLIIKDLQHNIEYANRKACRIMEKKHEQMLGMNFFDIFRIPEQDFEQEFNEREFQIPFNDSHKTLLCFRAFDYDKDRQLRGTIVSFFDISIRVEQRHLLEKMNEELLNSRAAIDRTHTEIVSNINYAKSIQQALFTSKEFIDSYFNNYFIIYKPKSYISGDFYYINQFSEKILICIGDCTGHGVSAALLTILGIVYLHEEAKLNRYEEPSDLLNYLRTRFKKTFTKFSTSTQHYNGLDLAIAEMNTQTNILRFAGANSPLWILRGGELIELKPTRNPIGSYPKEVPFETETIQLLPKDRVFMFSDGYKDQFGGENFEKIKSRRFKELIIGTGNVPLAEQKNEIEQYFDVWKGENSQTDDVLLFAFEV